ncbi:MAG: tetratricopeptide repeat protein [Planctomycetota bacterium]
MTGGVDSIEFIRHKVATHRRHYIDADDVKVVLSRLPEELWARLKKVHFKDDARGIRVLGYTTTRGRREITICALPRHVSLLRTLCKRPPEEFGALRGSQWPTLAVRRQILYDTFLHELGHLQVVHPAAKRPQRKFASETLAQQFADEWRDQLWSSRFDHPDPVHNPPDREELAALEAGWSESHALLKKGHACERATDKSAAIEYYGRALEHYRHPEALEGLGRLTYALDDASGGSNTDQQALDYLQEALDRDPALPDANLYAALALDRLDRREEAHRQFQRAIEVDAYHDIAAWQHAVALSNWGESQQAEPIFRRIIKRDPKFSDALRDYARLLMYRSDDYVDSDTRRAIDLLERAIAVKPDKAEYHYLAGLCHSWLAGEREAARHYVEAALSLDPGHEGAIELQAELTDA